MNPRALPLVLTLGLVLAPGTVVAQTISGAAESTQDRRIGVEQLTTSTVMRRAQANAVASSQPAANQSNAEPQIAMSRRDVNAPSGISNAADSRGGVAMVEGGVDRCDPARATAEQEACRDMIENHAAEFAHPTTPTISPESTLLAASRAGMTPSTGQSATTATTDAEQRGNQEIASVVLNQQQQQQASTTNTTNQPTLDANQQAIVNAVVQSITRGN